MSDKIDNSNLAGQSMPNQWSYGNNSINYDIDPDDYFYPKEF